MWGGVLAWRATLDNRVQRHKLQKCNIPDCLISQLDRLLLGTAQVYARPFNKPHTMKGKSRDLIYCFQRYIVLPLPHHTLVSVSLSHTHLDTKGIILRKEKKTPHSFVYVNLRRVMSEWVCATAKKRR